MDRPYSVPFKMVNGACGSKYVSLNATHMESNFLRFKFLKLKTELSPVELKELAFYMFIETLPVEEQKKYLNMFNNHNE